MNVEEIIFRIGSVFKGEGFTQAESAVKGVNTNVRKGLGDLSKLSGMLGSADLSALKAMNSISGLASAIMSFNAASIAMQTVMLAIHTWFAKTVEEVDELSARLSRLKAGVDASFGDTLTRRVAGINAEIKGIADEFDTVTKQANAFAQALEGVRAANDSNGIASLQIEKLNAMIEAHSEEERQNVEASYNLKIAVQQAADTESLWARKVEDAQAARVRNSDKVANVDEQLAKLAEERKQLESVLFAMGKEDGAKYSAAQKAVAALKQKEADLLKQRNELYESDGVLELKVQQTKVEQEAANRRATEAIKAAELSEIKLAEARSERADKELEAAQKAAETKARQEEEAKVRKESAAVQKAVNDSASELKKAQDEYREALKAYEAHYDLNRSTETGFASASDRAGVIHADLGAMREDVINNAVKKAIKDGEVRTVKDLDRFTRTTARQASIKAERAAMKIAADKRHYDGIMAKNTKLWTDQDKRFVKQYEKIREFGNEAKKRVDDAKVKMAKAEVQAKENHDNLKQIREKMEKLGLQ